MRFLDLSLTAFGPFTGVEIDLSQGQEGLHMIYGDNAAGKSSSLRAIIALLYGIPQRTADSHVHAYADLRIGAKLRNAAGAELAFMRRKANKRSLSDESGEVLPDDALLPFLAGVSRARFITAHGIDHQRLLEGGRNILDGKGDVGEILVESGLGGSQLRRTKEALQQAADALFTKAASKRPINAGLAQWQETRRIARDAALPPQRWHELDAALSAAILQREEIEPRRRALAVARARLDRLGKTLPLIARLRATSDELSEITAPLLVVGATQERLSAARALDAANEAAERNRRLIAGLRLERANLDVAEDLLARSDEVEALHERLAEYLSASRQQPPLLASRARAEHQAIALLGELRPDLSFADASKAAPGRAAVAEIEDLADRHGRLASRRSILVEAVQDAERRLAEVDARLVDVAGASEPLELKACLRRAQAAGDLEVQLSEAEQLVARLRQDAVSRVSSLGTSAGIDDVRGLPVPVREAIERFRLSEDALDTRLARAKERTDELEARRSRLQRELDELESQGEVPTEAQLKRVRRQRNRGWALVREHWLDGGDLGGKSPDMFDPDRALLEALETNMHLADEIADRLRREADRVARRGAMQAQLRELSQQLYGANRGLRDVEAEAATHRVRWRNVWSGAGVDAEPPREMLAWHDRHAEACQMIEALADAEARCQVARRQVEDHRQRLIAATGAAVSSPLHALVDRATAAVEAAEAARHARVNLERAHVEASRKLALEQGRAAEAVSDLEAWRGAWAGALEVLALSPDTSVDRARRVLALHAELADALGLWTDATAKLDALGIVVARFSAQTAALTGELAPDLDGRQPDEAATALHAKLLRAAKAQEARAGLDARIVHAEAELAQALGIASREAARLDALMARAEVASIDALITAEGESDRRRAITEQRRGIEGQLLAVGDGASLAALAQEAEAVDHDELEVQRVEQRRSSDEVEAEASRLDQEIGRLRHGVEAMDGSDVAAQAEQKAESIAAEVASAVSRYVRLRLAAGLLRRHMEHYRRDNEGPLIGRASTLFARMTLGEFTRIETALDDEDRPVIYGVRPTEVRVAVEGMSDGTRDQLYLALRLAALDHQLDAAAAAEPMPFIVDDVLVGLDDRRATATLEILAALSDRTQVLFFTHHARLVDLSEATLGARLFVHRLRGRGGPVRVDPQAVLRA